MSSLFLLLTTPFVLTIHATVTPASAAIAFNQHIVGDVYFYFRHERSSKK